MDKKVSPYKTGLDAGNAYWMARFSKEVYLNYSADSQHPDEARILANLLEDDPHFVSVFGFDNNSAQAILIEHQDYLCVAFRGTNERADWWDNLNVFSTQQLFGAFHRGFWQALEDIWRPIEVRFHALQAQKMRPLFFTGHSLGGAMATIAAAKLINDDKPFTSVYTFGQPRAVTRETALTINVECKARYFRFHHGNDIVTRVPSRMMGYSHVGQYFYIAEDDTLHQEVGMWFRFVDTIDGALSAKSQDILLEVDDHSIDHYVNAIEQWRLNISA